MLWQEWQEKIVPRLQKTLKIKSVMAVPRITKVIVHMGIAEEKDEAEAITRLTEQLSLITGQKPKICRAKKSVSGFKLRKGEPIGLQVTLRGKRMYDFLEKLFHLVLPRLRDFRGLPENKFDHQANYNLGIPEQTVFPEIEVGKVKRVKGVGVTIVTSTKDRQQAKKLLELLGLPFASRQEKQDGR